MEDLCICDLRVAKVDQLVQQLVADDKVVPDALLLHLLEVLHHDLLDLVEQTEEERHVGVGPGGGHDVDVAVLDVGKGALICLDQRSCQTLIFNFID